MEEKVKIFLKEVWFSPLIEPMIAERTMAAHKKVVRFKEIRSIGAIFCQINKIKDCLQLVYSITWGNQKWKGAIPAFIESARVKTTEYGLKSNFVGARSIKVIRIIITEAIAWLRKYLMALSLDFWLDLIIRMGMNLIRLISNPIQARSHEEEEQARKVPEITPLKKINWNVLIRIKKREIS